MAARSFEAYIASSPRPVFTFSHRDLAERYRERMEALGASVTIKTARVQRRAA